MRKINALFVGLTLSLAILLGVALEQNTSADGDGLSCNLLIGCKSSHQCEDRGTAIGCKITGAGGGSVTCPTDGELE